MTTTPSFSFPVAVCDIGGTNVRIAEIAHKNATPRTVAHVRTDAFPDLPAAIASQREAFTEPCRSLIVCAAGPVEGRRVKLTNAGWTIDGLQVARELALDTGLLLNDFEAQAIMLPSLLPEHTRRIGEVAGSSEAGTRIVLGPGTGLGAGLLLPWQGRLLPVMTEAGHMDFGPGNAFEVELWTVLRRTLARVTGETVISGPGTVRLYHALCDVEGVRSATDDAAVITDLAHQSPEDIEARTLRCFWSLVARFAGGLALGLVAKGGVVLSGGILKKIVAFLDPQEFRRIFDYQEPLQAIVAQIPVTLVTDDRSVLSGLAALAADPARFMIDYETRLWR